MRITHRRKKEEPKKNYRSNFGIAALEVMVLGKKGDNLGVMTTAAAIQMAQDEGMDLVEINPKSTPPVAKIVDFGQLRYQQEKEARLQKAHQHVVDIKGVRLSLRIGKHDWDIRIKQTLKFLDDGNKVKVEMMLRGREMQQGQLGIEMVKKFIAEVTQNVAIRTEQNVERLGNKVTTIIAKA